MTPGDKGIPPPRRRTEVRVLIVAAIIAAMLLFLFLAMDWTQTANNAGSGGPDEQWQAEPQPIPQLPPERESLDEPAGE